MKKKQIFTVIEPFKTETILTLDEVKEWLQITTNDFNSRIQIIINSCLRDVETFLNCSILTKNYSTTLDKFSNDELNSNDSFFNCTYSNTLEINKPRIKEISEIAYFDENNERKVFDISKLQFEYREFETKIYYFEAYPRTYNKINSVEIKLKAGFCETVEENPLKLSLLKLIYEIYYNCDCNKSSINKKMFEMFSNYLDMRVK